MTAAERVRLVALLPSVERSIGTTGMPEAAMVRLRGEEVRADLAELERLGLARQLTPGHWVRTATA